jgi:hypothetical protein
MPHLRWIIRSEISYAVMASVLVAMFAILFWLVGG